MNDLTLQNKIDENLRPIKVGGHKSALEISNKSVKVAGDLEITGNVQVPVSAGSIIGYTYLQPTDSVESNEIQNSMTVESLTHKVSFDTPVSEKVEIELSCFLDVASTDTIIDVGLSDNGSYNSIGEQFEYDYAGVFKTDDEADDDIITVKWVLESSQLASIGSVNVFWIGFSTSGDTKTAYVQYGLRSTHSISYPPFIIKATALPLNIYTG